MRIGYYFHLLLVALLTAGGLAFVGAETYRYAYAPGPLPKMEPQAIRKIELPGCYILWLYNKDFASLRVASDFSRRPNSLDPTRILDLEGLGFGFELWSDPRGFQCTAPPLALGPLLLLYPVTSLIMQVRRSFKRRDDSTTRCEKCSYDLTGNESGVCPECGTALNARRSTWLGLLQCLFKRPVAGGATCGLLLFASWFGVAAYCEWSANSLDPKSDSSTPFSRYFEELRAAGEPTTLHDIERLRPAVARQNNGALIIEGLAEQLLGLRNADSDGVFFFDEELSKADLFARVPESATGPSKAFLDTHSALVKQLRALADSKGGRLSFSCGEMAADPLGFQLPSLAPWRLAARLLALDALVAAQDGDTDGAVESIHLLAQLATTLDSEPTLIARLIQFNIDELTTRILEFLLRAYECDQRIVQQLADIVAGRLSQDSLKFALQCERASFFGICDGLADGKFSLSDLTGREQAGRMSVSTIRENQLNGGEEFDALITVADDPVALLKAAHEIDERMVKTAGSLGKRFGSHRLVVTLIPGVGRAVELHNICLARLRCASVVLAAQRFCAETRDLPKSMQALVPNFLDAVPVDPMNGAPLHMVATNGGMVVYSVGENLKDDGGSLVPAEGQGRGLDIGFRLSTEPGLPRP